MGKVNNSIILLIIILLSISGIIYLNRTGMAGTDIRDISLSQQLITISPQEAFSLIKEHDGDPDFIIIDLRTPKEYSEGYIPNAVNIDFYSRKFRLDLDSLDKSKTYLIYCHSGGRSGRTLGLMKRLGFQKVYNLDGGIARWEKEGLPLYLPTQN